MWRRIGQKHCSDEVLLAHLDGELLHGVEKATRTHLQVCWNCRARLAELEGQAQALSRSLAEQVFLGPGQVEAARQRFQSWQAEFERTFSPAPRLAPTPSFSVRRPFVFAAVAALCLTGFTIWLVSPSRLPQPKEVLARTQQFEEGFYGAHVASEPKLGAQPLAIHQSFRLEVRPIQPPGRSRVSRLQVWSESATGRFASRWQDPDGKLRYAVWRPQPGREYVYRAGAALRRLSLSAPKPGPAADVLSLADLPATGLDPERLEADFLKWLESRRWTALYLTSDFSLFCSQDGVSLHAERVYSENGPAAIRLVAERIGHGLRVQFLMEVDTRTYKPLVETVRFETPERSVELRLAAEQLEQIDPQGLQAAVFAPDSSLLSADRSLAARPAAPSVPSTAEIAALEVEALHRLDQIGAVLGEQVSLARTTEGKLQVRGVVESLQRKEEILGALGPIAQNRALQVDIRTVAEAEQGGHAGPSAGQLILRELEVNKEPTPAETELRGYFQQQPQKGSSLSRTVQDADAQVRQFAREMLAHSQQALLHAWALKHFVERFTPEELLVLPEDTRSKWHSLIREHARGYREETEKLRQGLEPIFFSELVPKDGKDEGDLASGDSNAPTELTTAIERLFRLGTAHDEAIRAAFVISAEKQTLDQIKSAQFCRSLRDSEKLATQIEKER